MSVLKVQDPGAIPSPEEGGAQPIVEGQVQSEFPEPPPETGGIGPELVVLIAIFAAALGSIAAFRAMLSWLVKQNRPYDSAKRWAGFAALIGAAVGGGLAVLLIRQAAAAIGGNGG